MFKKYITIQIIPGNSKKVKKFKISQLTGLLFLAVFTVFLLHTTWVFVNYFSKRLPLRTRRNDKLHRRSAIPLP